MKIIPLEEKWMEFYELPFMIADLFPYTVIKYQTCSIFLNEILLAFCCLYIRHVFIDVCNENISIHMTIKMKLLNSCECFVV